MIPSWMISTFVTAAQDLGTTCERRELVELANELVHHWANPKRCFHDCAFLRAAIARIDEFSPASHNPAALHLALWFYGVGLAYPLNPSDEFAVTASAQRCCDMITQSLAPLGVGQDACEHVCELVQAAISHSVDPGDLDTAVLVDALLSQFASKPQDYKQLRAALRRELAHLSEGEYLRYRRIYLRDLLERPQIFRSPLAMVWEGQARQNIEGELASVETRLAELGEDELPAPTTLRRDFLIPPIPAPIFEDGQEVSELRDGGTGGESLAGQGEDTGAGESERDPQRTDEAAAHSASEPAPEMSSLEMIPDLLAPVKKDAPRRLSAKEQARAARGPKPPATKA